LPMARTVGLLQFLLDFDLFPLSLSLSLSQSVPLVRMLVTRGPALTSSCSFAVPAMSQGNLSLQDPPTTVQAPSADVAHLKSKMGLHRKLILSLSPSP
jgi:hypothetical protein